VGLALCVALTVVSGVTPLPEAEAVADSAAPFESSVIPPPVRLEDFEAVITNSPFTRSLGVSDSLILTGVMHIDNDVVATLFDTKTLESHVVSKTANFQGWQLVGVGGNGASLKTWSARIQVDGGEIISVRYQQPPKTTFVAKSSGKSGGGPGGKSPPLSTAQLDEAKSAALDYKKGFNADGYPKEPPPEMVAKLSRLSVSQREEINRQMFGYRNQGLGLDERRKIYENLVDRSYQGRR
jgi:hypothetical protein